MVVPISTGRGNTHHFKEQFKCFFKGLGRKDFEYSKLQSILSMYVFHLLFYYIFSDNTIMNPNLYI